MEPILHITSGDTAGEKLNQAALPGEVFVWHDLLYDGPRTPGLPDEETLLARAAFLEEHTGGGLDQACILKTLRHQYRVLTEPDAPRRIILWFDSCLFDQAMLVHILACLHQKNIRAVDLLCVDAFPGIKPFHGLGQLEPHQFTEIYPLRKPVTAAQFEYAVLADTAFAERTPQHLSNLAEQIDAPIPWIPAAAARALLELPDPETGLGRLDQVALNAVRSGCQTPSEIFTYAAEHETPPQFWGDTTLWGKINALANRHPPLVQITGPTNRLPQWLSDLPLDSFRITPV